MSVTFDTLKRVDDLEAAKTQCDQAFPPELRVPNAETCAAIEELEADRGQRFTSIEALMESLHADN